MKLSRYLLIGGHLFSVICLPDKVHVVVIADFLYFDGHVLAADSRVSVLLVVETLSL